MIGTTPWRLLEQLARGEFDQHGLTVIEGWNFAQMSEAINSHKAMRHDTADMIDNDLMRRNATSFK